MCKQKSLGGLGFRDLRGFNLALLAKQGQKICSAKRSLLHHLYKACYFPNGCFMEVHLGPNPSYAWREIWETQKILKAGQQWRVEDGRSIKIWQDKWVLGFDQLNQSPRSELYNGWDDIVDTLLDANFKWHEEKIWSMFNPQIATQILRINLGDTQWSNTRIWSGERSILFSIKSVYYLIKIGQQSCLGDTSTTTDSIPLWKKIWSSKILQKFKIFAWHACQEVLPTLHNLMAKQIPDMANALHVVKIGKI